MSWDNSWSKDLKELERYQNEDNVAVAVKALSSALLAMRLATGFDAVNREIDFSPSIEEVRAALAKLTNVPWPTVVMPTAEVTPHRTMTREEYNDLDLNGWHMVCHDIDGFGNIGFRYL